MKGFHLSCLMVAGLAGTACATRTDVGLLGSASGPDPTGCYVLVFEQPQFMGPREYINGPRQYSMLTDLPFGLNWRRRIRSARVGVRATATMWADEGFQGPSQRLRPGSQHPALAAELTGHVEALELECAS